MEEKYAKDICDFFAKYNIASKFLRDGSLLKALLNDKIMDYISKLEFGV